MVEKILNSYGTIMTLYHKGQEIPLKGFLQPGMSLSQRSATKKISPLGEILGDTYLYIGPAEYVAIEGDILSCGGMHYEFRKAETVMYQNMPIYLWGLCVRKGGSTAWGQ